MQNRTYAKGRKQICEDEIIRIPRRCRERFLSLDSPHLRPLHEAGIRFTGTSVLDTGYRIKRFDPRWHSLIYTFEGSGELITTGKQYPLYPGSLYIAPAHYPHEYSITGSPWKMGWFCMAQQNGFHCAPTEHMVLASSSSNLLLAIFQRLTDDPENADTSHPEIMRDCVQLLMTILRRDTKSTLNSREQQQQRRLDGVFLAVHRDPSFNWKVSSLIKAAHLPFAEDRFRQLCSEIYGETPMKRVRSIRMQIAKELLRATDYPLRTIAPMIGYGNEFAFSTAFRKELGISPQRFRQGDQG